MASRNRNPGETVRHAAEVVEYRYEPGDGTVYAFSLVSSPSGILFTWTNYGPNGGRSMRLPKGIDMALSADAGYIAEKMGLKHDGEAEVCFHFLQENLRDALLFSRADAAQVARRLGYVAVSGPTHHVTGNPAVHVSTSDGDPMPRWFLGVIEVSEVDGGVTTWGLPTVLIAALKVEAARFQSATFDARLMP